MRRIGEQITPAFDSGIEGAPTTRSARRSTQRKLPQAGFGSFRVGEDGRLYFAGKSEHYHIPLGHYFPGFRLIEHGKAHRVRQTRRITRARVPYTPEPRKS
jgi:hypothetical protein